MNPPALSFCTFFDGWPAHLQPLVGQARRTAPLVVEDSPIGNPLQIALLAPARRARGDGDGSGQAQSAGCGSIRGLVGSPAYSPRAQNPSGRGPPGRVDGPRGPCESPEHRPGPTEGEAPPAAPRVEAGLQSTLSNLQAFLVLRMPQSLGRLCQLTLTGDPYQKILLLVALLIFHVYIRSRLDGWILGAGPLPGEKDLE
jgi:hypothetical protein